MADTPSPEARELAQRIRERYRAPGNEHVLELDEAAALIDRFAAPCQRVIPFIEKAIAAAYARGAREERERCISIVRYFVRGRRRENIVGTIAAPEPQEEKP